MAKVDPSVFAHLEWMGFVQPTGLVVSAHALVRAGAILNRNDREGQRLLQTLLEERVVVPDSDPEPFLPDFRDFATKVLGWSWSPKGYAGTEEAPIPPELQVHLPDYEETLAPDFAVRERDSDDERSPWQVLVRVLDTGEDLDKPFKGTGQLEASSHARMERLLRRTGVPAGLIFNGNVLRLISAPYGESSGWMDFRVSDMVQTAGRPICSALGLLLSEQRLLALPREKRLAALLEDSRKYQNTVSERLAEQVLHALYELMRGLQAAHDATHGELLRRILADRPDEVYRALLKVVLRLVFLLYSEERDMLPKDEAFVRHYSVAGLHERLRSDAALHPDTMDQRYGAWAQILVLSRMIFDGAECGELSLPRRHGGLFDPDLYPFLEGRDGVGVRQVGERIKVPLVPDGTVYRALEQLLVLDGERISYRALDVENIGSVYETMMGFRIETATGTSVAIKAPKKHGAPTTIDLDQLLGVAPGKRAKWIQDQADRKLAATVNGPVKESNSIEDLHHALDKVIDRRATPDLVPTGALVLQPSEARRKSGSHYTPRTLTEPIVRTTLKPILEQLREAAGGPPTPDQLLDLKVCDPAMGSGAFLVESCRQLGDALIESWTVHDLKPEIPADEDEVIHARRLVAQRCLYGVDRNPVAVDLAKVSLWLTTLAREHAFTFVDHALRHGDSLVGLTNGQIAAREWGSSAPLDSPKYHQLKEQVDEVAELRRKIREADESVSDFELRDMLDEADHALSRVRTYGDLVVEAFFAGSKDKERKEHLEQASRVIALGEVSGERGRLDVLRQADTGLVPFHWELEFPEVFYVEKGGFAAFVGNPPFMGGSKISTGFGKPYLAWLLALHQGAHGNGDLVAHFFRRAYQLLIKGGTFGFIATNTIAQGDTRTTGLAWIVCNGGAIYEARRRVTWPGSAAVVVSVIHCIKSVPAPYSRLDMRQVDQVSSYLFHAGGDEDPSPLLLNQGQCFLGVALQGIGFLFQDNREETTPIKVMDELLADDPNNLDCIRPYIGGAEVNESPLHMHSRYVIDFEDRSEAEARSWPELIRIVEKKVRPGRESNKREFYRLHWWQHGERRSELRKAISGMGRVLVVARVQAQFAATFLQTGMVYSDALVVFASESNSMFCLIQSGVHEVWARFFGSSMKDDLRYTPSDCFETFPFPEDWQTHPALEAAGQAYYDFRAELMVEIDLGLTKTYNRFHDPDEDDPKIVRLRELHAAMDRAVLDAYGWTDISTDCEFLLDYEDEDDGGSSRRKKPWRYRWPDEVRDEILARLLELNAERAKEETAHKKPSKPDDGGLFA